MNQFWQSSTSDGILTVAFVHTQIVSQFVRDDGHVERGVWTEILFSTSPKVFDVIRKLSASVPKRMWGVKVFDTIKKTHRWRAGATPEVSQKNMVRVFAWGPPEAGDNRMAHNIADYIGTDETIEDAVVRVNARVIDEVRQAMSGKEAA